MSEILGFDHVALEPGGATLSMSIARGQSLAIVGPAAAGKSRFLGVIAGKERPVQGEVVVRGSCGYAAEALGRRLKPQNLARKSGMPNPATHATELLIATRLWEARQHTVSDLTPSQVAACELLPLLAERPDLMLIDGQLDRLDPWALRGVMDHLKGMLADGCSVVAAVNRPDILEQFDALVILVNNQLRFAGTVDDLRRAGPPHVLTVATENQPGVRSVVAPFEVSVQETSEGLRIQAREGQELAARLMLEGYGDVKMVVMRPATIEESLLRLGS